jgi:hypothetical protein
VGTLPWRGGQAWLPDVLSVDQWDSTTHLPAETSMNACAFIRTGDPKANCCRACYVPANEQTVDHASTAGEYQA